MASGGLGDIYVMTGKTPDRVVAQYFKLVGKPVLVPQWTLGWNQCKWGYKTLQEVKDVVDNYAAYHLPLDVQWTDIDYLNKYRNFEYDHDAYAGLGDFVHDLHAKNMKYVPIIDAGLAYRLNGDYEAFNDGLKKDVFLKINNEVFVGEVWPSDSVYPDYTHPNTAAWWQLHLSNFYNQVPFDGLWEDMNEASNFCNGICHEKQRPAHPIKQNLKYIPTGRDLEFKSISLDVQHKDGSYQLDTHSLFGISEIQATDQWFKQHNKRTFIIERSSFAGMGKWSSRWLGDNFAEERFMGYSVSGVMFMNMFGITLAGADICGFIFDTTDALCTKWHVVGAFYPFSRNHNNWG